MTMSSISVRRRRRHERTSSVVHPIMLPRIVAVLSLLALLPSCVQAYQDSNPYPWGGNPNNNFRMYWKDASNILQDLNQFQALFIKVHGCVWSECGVDDYDDDGENRDGDENWYQYRTQEFCANAAYSLYGIKKGHFNVNSCSRGTYINSFFTYGGADVLADAVGLSVSRYYDDDNYGSSNAACYVVEEDENNNGNNNNNYYNDDSIYGMSSTMGCKANGRFAMANFAGQTCDGNYFLETTDNLNAYNRVMNRVNCKRIWGLNRDKGSSGNDDAAVDDNFNYYGDADDDQRRELGQSSSSYYSSAAEALLSNSWACDLDMYPNTCPDPYGKKRKYAKITRAAYNGQPTAMALANAKLKTPMRIMSVLGFIVGLGLILTAYYLRKREKIAAAGGGVNGWCSTMFADWKKLQEKRQKREQRRKAKKQAAKLLEIQKRAEARGLARERKKSKKGSKKKKKSPRSATARLDYYEEHGDDGALDDDGGDANVDASNIASLDDGGEQGESYNDRRRRRRRSRSRGRRGHRYEEDEDLRVERENANRGTMA